MAENIITRDSYGPDDQPSDIPRPAPRYYLRPPPALPPKPRITGEDVNVLILFTTLRRQGPVVKALAHVYRALTQVGDDGVLKFCQYYLGYSNSKLKKIFTADDRQVLSRSWEPEQQDITFLYKLFQHVCGLADAMSPVWSTPAYSLEYLLLKIKNERNFVMHDVTNICDENLKCKIQSLEANLREILELAGMKTNKNLDAAKQEMEREIRSVLKAELCTSSVMQKNFEKSRKIRQELVRRIISNGKKELCVQYEYFIVLPTVSFNYVPKSEIHIEEIFTFPEMVSSCGSSQEFVSVQDLLPPQHSLRARVSVVQGVAGAGKTCLCRYLVYCWSHHRHSIPTLATTDLLFLVRCVDVHASSFVDYITEDLLQNTLQNISREDVLPLLRYVRIMLVVDGWDEAGPGAKAILRQAIVKLPSARVFITTRPEFSSEISIDLVVHQGFKLGIWKNVELIGFNVANREEYIRKMFRIMSSSRQANVKSLLQYLRQSKLFPNDLTRLPQHLGSIVQLWEENSKTVKKVITKSKLYTCLFLNTLDRLTQRLRQKHNEVRNTQILRQKCHIWMLALGTEAWLSLVDNVTGLTEKGTKKLMDRCHKLQLEEMNMFSAMLRRCHRSEGSSMVVWEFLHNLMQQFLASRYLYNKIIKGSKVLQIRGLRGEVTETRAYLKYIETIIFTASFLCNHDKMTPQIATDIAFLLDAPEVRWENIGNLIQECEYNHHVTSSTMPLLVNEIVNTIKCDMAGLLLCTLEHTSLQITNQLDLCLTTVSGELLRLMTLVSERGCITCFEINYKSDICGLMAILEKESTLPKFNFQSFLEISFSTVEEAQATAFCLMRCQNVKNVTVYITCEESQNIVNIAAFLQMFNGLDNTVTLIKLPEKCSPKPEMESIVDVIVSACCWPGTLCFIVQSDKIQILVKAVAELIPKHGSEVTTIKCEVMSEDPYSNNGYTFPIYNESTHMVAQMFQQCSHLELIENSRECRVSVSARPAPS